MDHDFQRLERDARRDIRTNSEHKLEAMNALDSVQRIDTELKEMRDDTMFALRIARRADQDLRSERSFHTRQGNASDVQADGLNEQIKLREDTIRDLTQQILDLRKAPINTSSDYEMREAQWMRLAFEELRNRGLEIVPLSSIRPFQLNGGVVPTVKLIRLISGADLRDSKNLYDSWVAQGLI